MAKFDTLEVEVTQACPNPNAIEIDNCGAWDYIAITLVPRTTDADDGRRRTRATRARRSPRPRSPASSRATTARRTGSTTSARCSLLPRAAGRSTSAGRSRRRGTCSRPAASCRCACRTRRRATRRSEAHVPLLGRHLRLEYNVGRTPVDVPIPCGREERRALRDGHRPRRRDEQPVLASSAITSTSSPSTGPTTYTWTSRWRAPTTGCIAEGEERDDAEPGRHVVVRPRRLVPRRAGRPDVWDVTALDQPGQHRDGDLPRAVQRRRPARGHERGQHRAHVVPCHVPLTDESPREGHPPSVPPPGVRDRTTSAGGARARRPPRPAPRPPGRERGRYGPRESSTARTRASASASSISPALLRRGASRTRTRRRSRGRSA